MPWSPQTRVNPRIVVAFLAAVSGRFNIDQLNIVLKMVYCAPRFVRPAASWPFCPVLGVSLTNNSGAVVVWWVLWKWQHPNNQQQVSTEKYNG